VILPKEEKDFLTKILESWIPTSVGLASALGLLIGFFFDPWYLWLILGACFGIILGLRLDYWLGKKAGQKEFDDWE
jgi:hypothetical protein